MGEKTCNQYQIREEDAELLRENYGSVKRGVKRLVDKNLKEKDIIGKLQTHKVTLPEFRRKVKEDEDLELSKISKHKDVRAEDLAESHLKNVGVIKPAVIEFEFKKLGYSQTTAENIVRKLRDKYYPIRLSEIRQRAEKEKIVQEARDIYKQRIFLEEDDKEEQIEEVRKEAREKAKVI